MTDTTVHKGLIPWFARNSVAANLLMILLLAGGLFSALTIKKQVFPTVEINNVVVRVPYLGAAPQEVEEGVVVKIEEAIQNIEGIKKVTSTATEGLASVNVEVLENYDAQLVLDEVKVQVDAIPSFPANIEKPVVYRVKPQQAVLWVALHGDASERFLKEQAKQLRDEIADLAGISNVVVRGARDYEIAIELSELRLQEYGLTFDDVVRAVRRSSIDLPGGAIRSDDGDILLRTKGQAYTGEEFARLVVLTRPDGTRVLLGDIAVVVDGFVEDTNYAQFDGKTSVNVRVDAVGDQNALEISKSVNAFLAEREFPEGIYADVWGDASFYLDDRLNMMLDNMLVGGILVFIVLSLFLKIKLAFWVIVGLPVCFLGAIFCMPMEAIDVSINMISLFGFILVLGIVVDDAIIMGESAYAEIDRCGHSPDSVIRGVQRVAMPATFGVLTTIAAFVPMLMVPGSFGEIWRTIGWVVIVCLVFSLVESKLILPAHLVQMKLKPYHPQRANYLQRIRDRFSEGIKQVTHNIYLPFLKRAIRNRYITLATFLAALIITIGLFGGNVVRFVFFPNVPSDFIQAEVEMLPGSATVQRDHALAQIDAALTKVDSRMQRDLGFAVVKHRVVFDTSAIAGIVLVELTKAETREIDAFEIQRLWTEALPEIAGVKKVDIGAGGNFSAPDISVNLTGDDLPQLRAASQELTSYLQSFNGVRDVADTFSGGSDEIRVSIRPEAEALGLSLDALASQVRAGFYGAEAQRVQRGDEEVKVMIRYPQAERSSIANLMNMRIRTDAGQEIPFSQVAEIDMDQGYASIIRINGVRSIALTAKVNKAILNPQDVVTDVQDNFMPALLQKYPSVSFALDGQSKEQGEALVGLLKGAVFALFAIYALMAIPLTSYSQPIIIMAVIPFGIVGAIIGHLMLGHAVSVLSMCGIIALAGVVVNDSLIMVDFINRARARGLAVGEAALKAGSERFRAIVLTSLTTFMGLVPIILERSLQAQIVIPMAISLAFGILFATVITLILLPCLYAILTDVQHWLAAVEEQPAAELPEKTAGR